VNAVESMIAEATTTATVSPSSGGKVTWTVGPEDTCTISSRGVLLL